MTQACQAQATQSSHIPTLEGSRVSKPSLHHYVLDRMHTHTPQDDRLGPVSDQALREWYLPSPLGKYSVQIAWASTLPTLAPLPKLLIMPAFLEAPVQYLAFSTSLEVPLDSLPFQTAQVLPLSQNPLSPTHPGASRAQGPGGTFPSVGHEKSQPNNKPTISKPFAHGKQT